MIKKNILGLLFLLSALCLFNSCEDDPYYDDYGWATDAVDIGQSDLDSFLSRQVNT